VIATGGNTSDERGVSAVKMTETHLLSLDRDKVAERLALRRAYHTGCTVRTNLIEHNRLVRVVDYSET